jgi:2-polyprenyl-3-methyl-5-hydroxy-6-metoxy-1,4-benzoquinol methylase
MDTPSGSGQCIGQAEFLERTRCIGCDSERLRTLDRGCFGDDPHRSMILHSPWGESPLPHLERCEWELVECSDCSQVFHKRVLTDEWEQHRFSRWMTEEAIRRFEVANESQEPEMILGRACVEIGKLLCLEKMTRFLRKGEALRILDFGCGWGRFIALGSLLGFEAYGVDRSVARLDGSKSPNRVFPSWEAYRAEVATPPHVVTLFEVLEHLRSPIETLRTIHSQMVPSGLLVIEVPNCEGIRQIRTREDLKVDGIDHINAFTPATLMGIARRAGFEPVVPPIAQVTADFSRMARREARRLLRHFLRPTTQSYFRRIQENS